MLGKYLTMLPTTVPYPYAFNLFGFDQSQLKTITTNDPVLFWAVEYISEDKLLTQINAILNCNLPNKIYWMIMPVFGYSTKLNQLLGNALHSINMDLLLLYFYINKFKVSSASSEWNSTATKFLFLIGRAGRSNRLGLLYKFYKAGILTQCEWSLFFTPVEKPKLKKFLPDITDSEADLFLNQHMRNVDNIQPTMTSVYQTYCGYPFDSNAYSNTLFRVVSETMWDNQPLISEKTWITIANHHPFIIAGSPHSLEVLKAYGFRTFEEYLPVKNYDTIEDEDQRFDAVVKNTKHWLIKIDTDQISKDVEHNAELLHSMVQQTFDQYQKLRDLINPSIDIFNMIPLCSERHNWLLFYYQIKESAWPDCYCEENFHQLPDNIKTECVEMFGYQPKNQANFH
jgi:hypothetical protein